MGNEETKKCPYCAEVIKKEAVVCRFCGYDLKTGKPATLPSSEAIQEVPKKVQARSGVMDGVNLGCGMFIVLPLIIIGVFIIVFIITIGGC